MCWRTARQFAKRRAPIPRVTRVRTLAAPHQHRRVAATLQRAVWNYVPGRTAATRYRPQQRIRDAHRQLCVSPPRQTGKSLAGAQVPWPSGRNVGRRPDGKASGIRFMVYCQLEPMAGFQDFVSHSVRCPSVNCLLSHYPDTPFSRIWKLDSFCLGLNAILIRLADCANPRPAVLLSPFNALWILASFCKANLSWHLYSLANY